MKPICFENRFVYSPRVSTELMDNIPHISISDSIGTSGIWSIFPWRWVLNISFNGISVVTAITSSEVSSTDFLITTSLSLLVRAFQCSIAAKYSEKQWSMFTSETDSVQLVTNHDAQWSVKRRHSVGITYHAFPISFTKKTFKQNWAMCK